MVRSHTWFIPVFILIWSFGAWLFSYNLPLDVIENLAWGTLWQWGYYKHPPLMAWLQEGVVQFLGHSDYVAYLLSFSMVGLAVWYQQKIAKFMGATLWQQQLLPILSVFIYYYNFRAIEFNANVAQLPFWMMYIYYFLAALQKKQLRYWICIGFLAALGLLAKYSFGILLISSLFPVLLVKDYRHYLYSYKPYLAALVMILCISPHLLWLYQVDGLPLQYLQNSLTKETLFLWGKLWANTSFVISQIAVCLPSLLLLYILAKLKRVRSLNAIQRACLMMIIMPLLLTLIIGLLSASPLRTFWGYPFPMSLMLLPLIFYRWERREISFSLERKISWMVLLLPLLLYALIITIRPWVDDKGKRVDYDGRELAHIVEAYWQKHRASTVLQYVAGDPWAVGNISWYHPLRPKAIMNIDYYINPWLKKEDLPAEILFLGEANQINIIKEEITQKNCLSNEETINFPWRTPRYTRAYPLVIGVLRSDCLIK